MSGFCVAGKVVSAGQGSAWLRPVSMRLQQEIQPMDWYYEEGGEPALLDIISIPLAKPVPRGHQAENHLINATQFWRRRGCLPWSKLGQLVDRTESLWANGDSTFQGKNDRVAELLAKSIKHSLLLIEPEEVTIRVLGPNERFADPKRKVRAGFGFCGVEYDLMVTDPEVESFFLAKGNGSYALARRCFLSISLTEKAVNGGFYKLVAAVITERSS